MKKQIYYILLCFMLVLTGCSTAARLKKADRKYENGEYFAASEIYRKNNSKISTKKQTLILYILI